MNRKKKLGWWKHIDFMLIEAGATVLSGVSTDGYTYDDSEAIDGDKFLGPECRRKCDRSIFR